MTQGGTVALARECVGCGALFIARRHNQTRHDPECGRERDSAKKNAARAKRRAAPTRFVAIDGEGVTDEATGEHRYVLLSCGDKHLSNDGAQLNLVEILEFLWSCYETDPDAAYVGFYLSYDWSQWLRTLPNDVELPAAWRPPLALPLGRAERLLTEEGKASRSYRNKAAHGLFPVYWRGWDFDYLYGRRWRLRPGGDTAQNLAHRFPQLYRWHGAGKSRRLQRRTRGGWDDRHWMFICDAGPFFQCSFLKAIDPARNPNPVVTVAEYDLIAQGKARRSSAEFDPRMVDYNQLECDVLARLMTQHDEGIRSQNLKLDRDDWYGPGRIAQQWLETTKLPRNKGRGHHPSDLVPAPARDAARRSFFGGWSEQFWHGHRRGTDWAYDINSAYPFIMATRLPCLLHGGAYGWQHWSSEEGLRLTNRELDRFAADLIPDRGTAFVRAELEGSHPVCGAMLHRIPSGRVIRPQSTQGWFVAAELAAAIDAGLVDQVRLYEAWTFEPGCDCGSPLKGLEELYLERLRVGKNSIPGTTMKLIYNACAGKIQQSVGDPTWANPVYATLITSGCREMVLRAIASHPTGSRDLLQVATDGVIFQSRHPALDLDPERLGAWDEKAHDNLCLFQPGFYWDDEARARIRAGDAPVFKSRGIASRDFAAYVFKVDEAFRHFNRDGWPTLKLPVSFQLLSPKQALAQGDWSLCGTLIRNPAIAITGNPKDKRIASRPGRSQPWPAAADLNSTPYDGAFGDELRRGWEQDDGDHPDGPVARLGAEAMYG